MSLTWNGGCGSGGGGNYTAGTGISIQNNTISANRNESNTYTMQEVNDMIAATEENPSITSHSIGEYIIVDGALYVVTAAISPGDAITAGGNVTAVTVTGAQKDRYVLLYSEALPNIEEGSVLRNIPVGNYKKYLWVFYAEALTVTEFVPSTWSDPSFVGTDITDTELYDAGGFGIGETLTPSPTASAWTRTQLNVRTGDLYIAIHVRGVWATRNVAVIGVI